MFNKTEVTTKNRRCSADPIGLINGKNNSENNFRCFLRLHFGSRHLSRLGLTGRPRSFMSEFNEANKRGNGMVFLILLTVVIVAVIYINNR